MGEQAATVLGIGAVNQRLYTTSEAAVLLKVPAGRIRRWRHDEKAMPTGVIRGAVPGGEIPLWTLNELRPLAEAYHLRRTTQADARASD
ncbi:MAG: hypothetical protein H6515_14720 [Microthrixaceae bacterium]|jgi:hypothetical protein|nr:hypothetical protein [Microthrixaceae bacterium]